MFRFRFPRNAPVACALAVLLAGCGSRDAQTGSAMKDQPPASTRFALHPAWTRSIRPNADSVAAYLPNVRLPSGSHASMIYLLAANNSSNCNTGNPVTRATLYAMSAASGAIRWTRSTTGPSRCSTAAPAASGSSVYAPGLDGRVHRYAAGSGREYRGHGWPRWYTLMPDVEKVSANLVIAHGFLYVTTSGFIGDQGHYQGHLVAINLHNGTSHVFNSLCSNVKSLLGPTPGRSNYCGYVESGLFGRGQATIDPAGNAVYIVSGNGPWDGKTNWGDTVLKLNPDGTHLLDAFTPTNQATLAADDADLGSTGPALLPAIKQGSHTYHLLVQGGKGPACDSCSGVALRLLNRDNLSGQHGPGHLGGDLQDLQTPGGCEVLTAPAVWKSSGHIWVFYANDCGLAAYRLSSPSLGRFQLSRIWSSPTGGTTPVMSGGVLYVAGGGRLTAYRPTTGAIRAQVSIGPVHWEYPRVAGHRVFISDETGAVRAFTVSG
ncbi:MAG: PQQ-binding-like beta-propeller repeat protein [Chloroflexota bacterium]